ncbi:MAG TPA: hypothetical protein VKT73_09580 [Xanthobacteraceae bacterium]|nr:hypothetical protein [Xanthobacteraceae bacterium]
MNGSISALGERFHVAWVLCGITGWLADFLCGKLLSRLGTGNMAGIGRTAFKVWLTASIVWIITVCVAVNAGGYFPAHYQTDFPLRADLEPWQKEWSTSGPLRHPLYEIIRSPSVEKLPLEFQWRGYQGAPWNQHIHAREMPQYNFPSGETLDLPAELTDADRDYIKQYFWDHRWKRWKETLGPYARAAIYPSLIAFMLLWLVRQVRTTLSGKESEPPPRLPYSPRMEWLRKVTLAVSGIEILFWVVVGFLNQREDPQAILDVLSIMFAIMLPALAAFVMSLLHRGPRMAAALAGLALWMMLPEVAIRIAPASWLPN